MVRKQFHIRKWKRKVRTTWELQRKNNETDRSRSCNHTRWRRPYFRHSARIWRLQGCGLARAERCWPLRRRWKRDVTGWGLVACWWTAGISPGVAMTCSVIWCSACCLTMSICLTKMNWDVWPWIASLNRLRRGVTRGLLCMVITIWAITTLAWPCSSNSQKTPRNSHNFWVYSQKGAKTPPNSHKNSQKLPLSDGLFPPLFFCLYFCPQKVGRLL